MKQFKKRLSLLLAIALCVSLLAVSATATTMNDTDLAPTLTANEAKVGETEYPTLAEAISAAEAGATVTLLKDVTASEIIVIDKALTLDGGSHTLTSSADRAINVTGANGVTIQNLTIQASGERAINVIQNATNVTITNVTATASNYTVNVAGSAPNAVVNITNSTLTGLNVVNIGAAGANITISASTVTCNDQNETENYGALTLNKDATSATITATSVTFDIKGDSYKASNGAANGIITIDGSTENVTQMVAILVTQGDYYHSFASLNDAIDCAKTGETIQLIKDTTLTEDLLIDKNITVLGCEHVSVAEGVELIIRAGKYDADVSTFAPGFKCVANEDGLYSLTQKVDLPEVTITDITDTVTDPELTFALNFAIKDLENFNEEYLNDLFAGYGHYYTDYVLTIKGLTDADVTFNANGDADGYLGGQYDAWSENWVCVPFSDVTVNNGESLYIMEYAATLMGQSGLRFTLAEVATIVQDFDCGVYFTPAFLEANHDMEVTLELKIFREDEDGNKIEDISVATNYFNLHSTTEVPAKAKTCTTDGNIAHWKCECGKLFADKEATQPLTEEEVILKASHKLEKADAIEATCTKEGTAEHYKCTGGCGQLFSDEDAQTVVTAKDLVVAMKAHKLEEQKEVPATYTDPGKVAHYLCSVCKNTFSDAEGKTPITKLDIPQLIEVVGDKAEVSEGALDVAIEAAGTTGDVKLDLTHDEVIGEENAPVSSAELPVAALEKVAEKEATLTLTKADATVTLDAKALEAVAEQAEGTTVTLVVEEIETKELTQTQQTAIEDKKVAVVISAELICNETKKPIGTEAAGGFGEGKVTVKIPFTPEEGFKGTDYMVYYVADDGSITPVTTGYEGGYLFIELEHFSEYVVVNTAAEVEPKPTEPTVPETTKPTEPTVPETTKPTEPTVPETTVPETTVPQETTKPTEATKPSNPTVPDTGDNSGVTGMMLMMLASGTAMAGLWLSLRKKVM